MPKAGGKWNNSEITAKGSHLTIVFNGSKTVDIQHAQFTEGPISLQFANREKGTPGGAIKWRKVQIRPFCSSRHRQRSGGDFFVYGSDISHGDRICDANCGRWLLNCSRFTIYGLAAHY